MEIRGQLHDNYMFYFNTNCHEFPTNYHEFYLLSRWIELGKNNYMINSWTITCQLYVYIVPIRMAFHSEAVFPQL